MRNLILPERRILIRLAVVFAAALAGAVALGWSAGQTPVNTAALAAKDPWTLQAAKNDGAQKDLEVLTQRKPWTGVVVAAQQQRPAPVAVAPPRVTWRLAGIVQRGDEMLVMISTGQGPQMKFEYRHVGDKLPDGTILVQISDDGAKTQASSEPDSEARSYRLFKKN